MKSKTTPRPWKDQEAIDAAEAEYQEAKDAVDSLNAAQQDAANSANDVAAQEQAVTDVINSAEAEIQELVSAYTDAYNAAYDSISKQYDLWDTAEKVVATSASSINSALESQITYWDNYNQNLENLTERAADIDGLSDVIASFADGSKDSVNAIAGMAAASDSDLAKMVENYRSLQEAQKTTSESMADLETGMSNAMDEIAQNVADSVADMDLNDEAMKSAQSTVQGFIDGAEGMMPRVKEAYEKVANAASDALAGANKRYNIDQKNGNIPGYAVGTESAAPGFAIVGENGPELVYFNGGETVLTAPETRAAFNEARQLEQITSTNAIDLSAVRDAIREEQEAQTLREEYNRYVETVNGGNSVYFNGGETRSVTEVQLPGGFASGGSNTSSAAPITVAPVYHIYGMRDTDELRSVLNAQNDDLREAVLEIVSDNDTDNFRRGYA